MKKKLITLIVAFVCVGTCAFGLAACNNGDEDVSDLFAASAENAEKQKSVDLGSFVYGEDAAINDALGKLKFYKKLMNDSYKEVAVSDMTVEYKKLSENKTLSAKPEKYTAGDYQLTYGLEGVDQTCDAYFRVEKATDGEFTVTLSETTWKYGDASATAEIKNPSSITVQEADTLSENDADCFGIQFFGIKKSAYNGHPQAHKTYSALTTYEDDETKPNFGYNKYFGKALQSYYPEQELSYGFMQGEYVLIACVYETYNYKEIVCETTFTVTDPESPSGKTFVFADLTVVGEGGGAAPESIASQIAQLKKESAGKTLIFGTDNAITGTWGFFGTPFGELAGEAAFKLIQFGKDKDQYSEADPVYVKIQNGGEVNQYTFTGQFYGGKLYLNMQGWTEGDASETYYATFTFEVQAEGN